MCLAIMFVMMHALLLLKTLSKIHAIDNTVLLLPIAGLSASAMVAGFALMIHTLSG